MTCAKHAVSSRATEHIYFVLVINLPLQANFFSNQSSPFDLSFILSMDDAIRAFAYL